MCVYIYIEREREKERERGRIVNGKRYFLMLRK